MKYENRIVCFIDILGFKSIIGKTLDKNGDDIEAEIQKVHDVLEGIKKSLELASEGVSSTKAITQFSDSIVISFDYTEKSEIFQTLLDIKHVIMELAYKGILCRGGVSVGKVVHNNAMLFGPAMNDAYTLESKAANYPRIILSQMIIDLAGKYRSDSHSQSEEQEYVKSLLGQDSDGMYYIDYVKRAQRELDDPDCDYPAYLMVIAEIIKSGIESDKPDIYVKYSWLKERYMETITPIHEKLSKNKNIDEVSQCYLELPTF